jgi:dTDP-4-dehydrorhamnose reductase
MLGQALVREFEAEELTAWDKNELDITNREEVQKKIAEEKPEIIINAAAYTAVDDSEKNRDLAFAVNADGVANIAAAAREMGANVVHYSTDYVFSGTQVAGYQEDDQPGPPVNAYGESKLAGEQALQESGAPFWLLRTAWLYGPGGKNFVDTMLRLGKEKSELRVINDQHGSPTYTRDLAAATRTILEQHEPNVYHLTNGGITTWYEFAVKIFGLTNNPIPVTPITSAEYPTPARRPAHSILLNTRGPTMRPWTEAVAEYFSLFSN